MNYLPIDKDYYFIYGMMIGLENKILVGYKKEKPNKPDIVRDLCTKVFEMYQDDCLNPLKLDNKPS